MIIVTGASGQLGYDVMKELKNRNIICIGIDIDDLDITDSSATHEYFNKVKPNAVIHCAAYTAVDKAEDEPELCYKVNVEGTRNIALACKQVGAKMMYISTDYVFPGIGDAGYEVSDLTSPISTYGKTKLRGELVAAELLCELFIIRISWVFGVNGNNFVKTMLRLGNEKEEITVVCDQIGSPTYTADLAVLLCDMICTDKYAIYHATNEGHCSWNEFASEIMRIANLQCEVKEISTSEYNTKAKRPLNSRLSKITLDQAGFNRLPHWKDALIRYIKEIQA